MPDRQDPAQTWESLNDRQRIYLKAIYREDQNAESRARAGFDRRPAAEWRWLLYSVKASKKLLGRRPIQQVVERQGELDSGAGSSLAALRRRGLVETRATMVDIGIALVPGTEVQLTRTGRAVARAGLGEAAPRRAPAGLLSREYLWDAMAWLYEAGERGFEHIWSYRDQPPEQSRFRPSWNTMLALQDRRDGSFWEHPKEDGAKDWEADYKRYRLSPLGRRHYEIHWACYEELYPDVEAPQPPGRDDAHRGLGDHSIRKPRGLLTLPQWRLLAALVDVHRKGDCPVRRIIARESKQRNRPVPDLSALPNGLLGAYIARYVTSSKTAAAKLVERRGEALAQYADVSPFWNPGSREVPMLHVTEAGLAHYDEHLATYRKLYPDVPLDTEN